MGIDADDYGEWRMMYYDRGCRIMDDEVDDGREQRIIKNDGNDV